MAKKGHTGINVLPKDYIPVISKKVIGNILNRLPKSSLVELLNSWPRWKNTQPYREGLKKRAQKDLNEEVIEVAGRIKRGQLKVSKKWILDQIVSEYWTRGLNLLQISQVDSQLIVDRPNSYYWVSSTVKDSHGESVVVSLDPQRFLDKLVQRLSRLYMTYVYVCKHPKMPLMLIRIQIFDLKSNEAVNSASYISSHRPYFLAISENSPHIIHSTGSDMVTNIVLQVVESCLSQHSNNILRIVRPENQIPVRSLETMHIFHGNSRFGNSLGMWIPYADGTVDISPLGAIEKHVTLKRRALADKSISSNEAMANLKFKGSVNGVINSTKLFDDVSNRRKKRRRSPADKDGANDDSDVENFEQDKENKFRSIAPVQYSEFILNEKFANTSERSTITMKLVGSDIFGGLHELSSEHPCVLNPAKVPLWLTGEEKCNCGIIKDRLLKPINA